MFSLKTKFSPVGDQKTAIKQLSYGLKNKRAQVLLGITGSGKTFTMANVIQKERRPTLILAHNKTLAAQLYQEFRSFFPDNAVEYFVSYYDYYQPEAYIPRTDTYIEKDLSINEVIERMRLSATRSLIERKDVIVISSVSCIYGLGLPECYKEMVLFLSCREKKRREEILFHLVAMHYERSDYELKVGSFRARGDILEIMPAYEDMVAYRIELFGEEIEKISIIDPLTGRKKKDVENISIYPGSHYVSTKEIRKEAISSITKELEERIEFFEKENKLIEKQRITERTFHDLEMIKEIGFCKGIENYSRHFSKRRSGEPPPCLLDYFPEDFFIFIDESHQTIPQLHAMYNGDRARKKSLIEYGFRLPSAYDNRPLKFEEVFQKIPQMVFVSATPGKWEIDQAEEKIVQQITRPTGLLDPEIEVKSARNQVDDVLEEIRKEVEKGFRILITTLTKKLAEDLSKYLEEIGIKAKYMHSSIDTLQRIKIIKELREGIFDVLVGVNLLREGLDIPEVSLVAIMDADKEGFLRSEVSLIQTCGRAARNEKGRVIMYADKITSSIKKTLDITKKRREYQIAYNEKHHIIPKTIKRTKSENLEETFGILMEKDKNVKRVYKEIIGEEEIERKIKEYQKKMKKAAKELRFEDAAHFRDMIKYYQSKELVR